MEEQVLAHKNLFSELQSNLPYPGSVNSDSAITRKCP